MMLILMLIMMLKLCVKESPNLIDLENFGDAGFSITARFRWHSPYQSKSDQISIHQILEIPTVIACNCWSLPICKIWITLDLFDHFHLKWLKVLLLFLPYHMQKTNFITQLILEIKLTHYLLSLWYIYSCHVVTSNFDVHLHAKKELPS